MTQIIITPWGDEMDKDEYDMIRREEEHDRMLEAQEHGADDDDDYLDQGFGPDEYEYTMGIRDEADEDEGEDSFDSTSFGEYTE